VTTRLDVHAWRKIGRDGRIRTGGPLTPSQVRYQAALHPDVIDRYRRRAREARRAAGLAFAAGFFRLGVTSRVPRGADGATS
jgi:hypothetical protein